MQVGHATLGRRRLLSGYPRGSSLRWSPISSRPRLQTCKGFPVWQLGPRCPAVFRAWSMLGTGIAMWRQTLSHLISSASTSTLRLTRAVLPQEKLQGKLEQVRDTIEQVQDKLEPVRKTYRKIEKRVKEEWSGYVTRDESGPPQPAAHFDAKVRSVRGCEASVLSA